MQVPTDGIVHDPRKAADLVTPQREFQNRRYSPDEKRHFLRNYARDIIFDVPGYFFEEDSV
ncbi:hypothetical protein CE91St62_09480 [Lachnospiraceae bacterium]|nr:hypothetical protein CE91St61_09570 [Lachnospiraceae bacterium]BDF36887.1 hypothetical protein CE91St62_09480 [Lachnospiraceae bacterium]